MIVATVRQHHIRAAPGPTALAPHERHGLEQWDQLGDIVAVTYAQDDGKRDPGGVIR
ncbi:hypothetical protein GCM10010255_78520 [Streptomyces coeruleofuscus]|uniref:Transposase n=1 Tax=Streptomyces coeruleofuscus TaxID=66879 RepID=A0ABN3JBD7_9ACTN